MRVDKFLKVSRILKRRTVSKELALHDRIEINGRLAKPSSDVKAGDIVDITYGRRVLEIRVLSTPDHTKKDEAKEMYEILSETFKEETFEL